jgi:Protein of unknown function (DUF2510)
VSERDAPIGWYADPQGGPFQRYWTGTAWADFSRPLFEYLVWSESDSIIGHKNKIGEVATSVRDALKLYSTAGWKLVSTANREVAGSREVIMLFFERPRMPE